MEDFVKSAVVEVSTQPICMILTHMINFQFKFIPLVKSIYKNNGIAGFYSALVPAVATQFLSTFMKYEVYSNLKLIQL